ncbi:uncharacterized protein N7477_001403 [Penicillium maclennaniae]|uniref:uncharacterized protein n=1 Tax=Penicillium maclennaniae TaxID=1343394 RepID=UPI0025423EA6|nr:uncharacterized protein N7477_001403 [Penicillium maclennaniae]KAJ5681463.1 hypothetical protein N7477_001403 [Penicillium maclennaniae]
MTPHPRVSAQYHIAHSVWRHDYEVSGSHVFHVDNSSLRPGKPDLTFHAGLDTNAPLCKFRHFSSDTEIGLGDPSKPGISWERMSRESLRKVQYAFGLNCGDGRHHRFTWKKTSSLGGSHSGNLKLVDESSGNVVAVFSSGGSFSMKTGQLDIYTDYGERFAIMVLISGIALREKLRRAKNASGNSVGSAGAAGGGC